jgi:hypothetical protein
MAMELRGEYGEAKYGYRLATRLHNWELTQEDGDPGVIVEVERIEDDEFFGTFAPTELRLKLGARWMIYRTVARISETQWRAEGRAEVQSV